MRGHPPHRSAWGHSMGAHGSARILAMAIRKIATIGHPVLRKVARPLTLDELRSADTQRFIDDLVETMFDANGAGIAANQVYEPIRVCAVCVKDNPRYP